MGETSSPRAVHRAPRRQAGEIAAQRRERLLFLMSWISPLILIGLWEAASRTGHLSVHVLPPPSGVVLTAWKQVAGGTLFRDLFTSLARAMLGFLIGGGVGFTLGTLVGFSRIFGALIDRSVQMLRAIPFLALLPLVIVWFGVGEAQKIFMVSLGVMFPIYINTVLGIRQVDPKLIELGRVCGLGRSRMIREIVLPGALPSLLTGVRYSLATAWLALVVAETIGASAGIGYLALDAREFLRTDVVVLTIVIYAGIGIMADSTARFLERRLLDWHPSYAREVRR
jgi:sulfonate transport system permease protein